MVRVGKVEAATIQDWVPEPGKLVSWQPSPATLTKASQAPISTVPPSYMQTQHLRNYRAYVDQGLEMSRLVISAWNVPGRCDIRTMTHVINTHLRRHDTYRCQYTSLPGSGDQSWMVAASRPLVRRQESDLKMIVVRLRDVREINREPRGLGSAHRSWGGNLLL